MQSLLLAAFALSFAIKVPMVPLHTWLPDAHVEAPTAGSVILAGVMLKMGTYGFMKLGFPLFPDATQLYTPVLMALAVVSIVYGACLALVQDDIKKIIAYSSISHLGYVMLGLLSLELIGIQGAIIQMVSHGLVAGGLFLMVGMIYERCHTRELARLRRARQAAAGLFGVLHDPDAGLGRPADDERLHRRVPGPARRVQGGVAAARQRATSCRWSWPSSRSPASCWARSTCCASRSASSTARARAPHQPFADLDRREKAILAPDRRRRVRARPVPERADGQDRAGGEVLSAARDDLAPPERHPMIGQTVLTAMLPEHLLLLGIVLVIALEIVGRGERAALAVAFACVAAAAVAALRLGARRLRRGAVPGQFSVDASTLLVKAMVLALALPVLLMARGELPDGEFAALLLSSLYGVCLLQSADSFATLFLGLELMSLPVYVLVLLAYRRPQSAEAALKYLVLGGTATATFLMGASLLYGSGGSLGDRRLRARARAPTTACRAPPSSSSSSPSSSRGRSCPSMPGRPMPTRARACR